jgi:hypothetical protein
MQEEDGARARILCSSRKQLFGPKFGRQFVDLQSTRALFTAFGC